MLARHAESLFWAGRYLERAQDTARLLDVTYHSQIETRPRQARQAWLELLQVLSLDAAYLAEHATVDAEGVNDFLVLDPRNSGAVVTAVGRARENARSVRELLSNDLWLAINDLYLYVTSHHTDGVGRRSRGRFLERVIGDIQRFAGIVAATMCRDDAYHFLALGRLDDDAVAERAELGRDGCFGQRAFLL